MILTCFTDSCVSIVVFFLQQPGMSVCVQFVCALLMRGMATYYKIYEIMSQAQEPPAKRLPCVLVVVFYSMNKNHNMQFLLIFSTQLSSTSAQSACLYVVSGLDWRIVILFTFTYEERSTTLRVCGID